MWKKLLLVFLICFSFSSAKADSTIVDVIINGEYIDFDMAFAHLKNNKTFIPLRKMSDLFSSEVVWNEENKSATVINNNISLEFYKDKKIYTVNGNTKYLSDSCFIEKGVFYVPARDFFDILNISFIWDGEYYSIIINNENINIDKENIKYLYEEDHIYWLSRIIHAESNGEVFEGKIAVGNVVLNRVESPLFPDTIYTVIFDKNHGVQYEPVINNSIYNTPGKESVKAAKWALNGFNTVKGCLYFFNPKTATNSWIKNNRTFFKSIGNHDFYL